MRVIGTFPDGASALMLVTVSPEHVTESERGSRSHLKALLLDVYSYRTASRPPVGKCERNLRVPVDEGWVAEL